METCDIKDQSDRGEDFETPTSTQATSAGSTRLAPSTFQHRLKRFSKFNPVIKCRKKVGHLVLKCPARNRLDSQDPFCHCQCPAKAQLRLIRISARPC
eukprot:763956-Hanusia_phi.AAC.2